MTQRRYPFTVGGRVNAHQMARLDAAARLAGKPRAHFLVEAALQQADEVLRRAAQESGRQGSGREEPVAR